MPTDISKLFDKLKTDAGKATRTGCLWPKEYQTDSWECAWEFVKICETWDEATSLITPIPDHDYLKNITREWWETRRDGIPLVIEKSRRLVVSWLLCALDVWEMGMRRCNLVQTGVDYSKASDFVWRCYFIYDGLRKKFPRWKLAELSTWGNPMSQHLDRLAAPNESIIDPLNSSSESFRGSGYSRVKLEELSTYPYVSEILAQARLVTQARPGEQRGHVVLVCNASASEEWQEVKAPPDDLILPDPQEAPYFTYNSKMGYRVVRVHFHSDPSKQENSPWTIAEKIGIPPSKWAREMDLYDKEAEGALWTQDLIDSTRVETRPTNLTSIFVSVDPSVSDPKAAKDATKIDDTGIVVVGITDDYHGYVLEDASGLMSPLEWAQKAVTLYAKYGANGIIAEKNQGGVMVEMTIKQVSSVVPVQLVHASIGKRARAEPIAGAYELGRVHHVGVHRKLEKEMTTWNKSTSKSPGRIDALTQAITASGMLDMLPGGIVERFPDESQKKPEDFVPDLDFFDPGKLDQFDLSGGWDQVQY